MPFADESPRRAENPFLWAKLGAMAGHFNACERVLEIGPNQGEFLMLLKDQGVAARGVDLSPANAKACRARGLDARPGDGLKFLAQAKPFSFDGFFCSNVLEHLPPEKAARLLDLACAKLKPGGVLGLMTGNTRCLAWVSGIFWGDLTHVRPYPLDLLQAMLKARGMEVVESGEDEHGRAQGPLRRLGRALKTALIGPFFGPPEVYLVARKSSRTAHA